MAAAPIATGATMRRTRVRLVVIAFRLTVNGRLESCPDRHPILPWRRLSEEAVGDAERVTTGPVHVRIDAVAVVPPHHVLTGHRDLRPSEIRPGEEALGNRVRERDLAEADVVARIDGIEQRPVVEDRVSLEARRTIAVEELQILVGAALTRAVRTIAVLEDRPTLHRHQRVELQVAVAECVA